MTTSEIEQLEERLRQAMLTSDTATLEELISDRLLFATLDGANVSKEADLATHRSGALRLTSLEPSERHIELYGEVAVVNVAVAMSGSFAGTAFAGHFRYTRVWHQQGERIQIVAGHMCAVQAPPA